MLNGWPKEQHDPHSDAPSTWDRATTGQTASNVGTNPTSSTALLEGYAPCSRVLRLNATTSGLAQARVSVSLTRGQPQAWTVTVPPWGLALTVPAGRATVAGWITGGAPGQDQFSASMGLGYLCEQVTAQELGPGFVGPTVQPPAWAQWVEFQATVAATINGAAVPALQLVRLAAQPLTITTAAGPGNASLLWRCYL